MVVQSFRGSVVRGKANEKLNSFIQRAICAGNTLLEPKIKVLKMNCLEMTNLTKEVPDFKGAGLVFVDIAKASYR